MELGNKSSISCRSMTVSGAGIRGRLGSQEAVTSGTALEEHRVVRRNDSQRYGQCHQGMAVRAVALGKAAWLSRSGIVPGRLSWLNWRLYVMSAAVSESLVLRRRTERRPVGAKFSMKERRRQSGRGSVTRWADGFAIMARGGRSAGTAASLRIAVASATSSIAWGSSSCGTAAASTRETVRQQRISSSFVKRPVNHQQL